jgi:5-formyltetrahydrofolate cyclo-ligase
MSARRAPRPSRAATRAAARALRRALTSSERARHAARITTWIANAGWLRAGRRVGLYVAISPEVATATLLTLALSRGCQVWLPRIVDYGERRMVMCRYRGGPLMRNRYGIGEPTAREVIDVRRLDVLLMPTLAFDDRGVRLGAGLGYYDRLLSWRLDAAASRSPLLVGVAYACSRHASLAATPHDVPLDVIVTEAGIHRPGAGAE